MTHPGPARVAEEMPYRPPITLPARNHSTVLEFSAMLVKPSTGQTLIDLVPRAMLTDRDSAPALVPSGVPCPLLDSVIPQQTFSLVNRCSIRV